jgi:ankyrin repeat protein
VDEFGKSPLHYAAQRGATTCSLYLLSRGVQLEREDKNGTNLCSGYKYNSHAWITLRQHSTWNSTCQWPSRLCNHVDAKVSQR